MDLTTAEEVFDSLTSAGSVQDLFLKFSTTPAIIGMRCGIPNIDFTRGRDWLAVELANKHKPLPHRDRYKILNGNHIGYFNVDYSSAGRTISADLFTSSLSFSKYMDDNGHVEGAAMGQWIHERIFPLEDIGFDGILQLLSTREYELLRFLQFTSARNKSDMCSIDFSETV
jgi:hypothetical protein